MGEVQRVTISRGGIQRDVTEHTGHVRLRKRNWVTVRRTSRSLRVDTLRVPLASGQCYAGTNIKSYPNKTECRLPFVCGVNFSGQLLALAVR